MYVADERRYEEMQYSRCGKSGLMLPQVSLGLLTDRYLNGIPADSRIRTDGRFLKENAVNKEVETKVRKLNEIAKKRGQTLAQMSLAWILRDDDITSVLIGASKPSQILDNVECINNTKFSEEERKLIDEISSGK